MTKQPPLTASRAMASMTSSVLFLLASLGEGRSAFGDDTIWTVANVDAQTCTQVCEALVPGRFCATDSWPSSTLQMLQAASEAGMTCKSIKTSLTDVGVTWSAANECLYSKATNKDSCALAGNGAAAGTLRICPCATSAATWKLGLESESCAATCKAYDGKCAADAALNPYEAQLNTIKMASRATCTDTSGVGAAGDLYHPSQTGAVCKRPNAADMGKFDCTLVAPAPTTRICPCIDADGSRDASPLVSAPVRRCNRKPGQFALQKEGIGGTKKETVAAVLTKADCLEAVEREFPQANAATWIQSTKRCFGEIGVVALQTNALTETCWFPES